jgi:hypothetical protein
MLTVDTVKAADEVSITKHNKRDAVRNLRDSFSSESSNLSGRGRHRIVQLMLRVAGI